MKRTLMLLTGAACSAMLWTGPAEAGPPAWTMDPGEGPPGTEVTIHGSCADDVNEWVAVSFYVETEDGELLEWVSHPITRGESWDLPIVVPETESGPHQIGKQCHRVEDDGTFGGGEATTRQPFEVTEPLEPGGDADGAIEPTDEPTPTPAPTPEVVAAAPAVPITRAPAFTG